MKRKLAAIIPLFAILLITGIFFYKTIFQGLLPIPSDALVGLYHPFRDYLSQDYPRGFPFKNFLTTDPVRQQIPWRKAVVDQWKQGRLPAWNPYAFSGTPLSGNIQSAAFYPLNIIFFWFSFPIAWTILVVLQPILAGIFMYVYLRSRGLHPIAGIGGAMAWMFSGFNVAWLTWGTMVQVALWLPLILIAIDKIIALSLKNQSQKILWWIVCLGLVLSLQFLAGHIQISLYLMAVAALYFGWVARQAYREHPQVPLAGLLYSFAVALGIFILLTMVQWYPTARLISESSRLTEFNSWLKEGWFLPWQHLVQFLAPDFFGNPTTLNYWGQWNYGEFIGYIGIVPLLFAVYALISANDKMAKYWKLLLLGSLAFVLPTPIAKLPFWLKIPVLSSLQPTRLMMVIDVSLAILTAYGIDNWLRKPERKIWLALMIIGLIFSLLWVGIIAGESGVSSNLGENLSIARRNLILPTGLYLASLATLIISSSLKIKIKTGRISKAHLVTVFLVGIAGFDLIRFGWKFIPFTPSELFYPETPLLSFLKAQPQPYRIMTTDDRVLAPNVATYYGIESIGGYDPLYLRRYEEFMASVFRGIPDVTAPYGFNRIIDPHNFDSPLLPLLNVRYIVSLSDIKRPFLKKVFQEGETSVYENTAVIPRIYFAENALIIKDKAAIINYLHQSEFDARKTAVLEEAVAVPSAPLTSQDVAEIVDYEGSNLSISTSSPFTRLLVVANSFADGWRASLDGKPAPIYRVNYILMGAIVPAGRHTLVLNYH